MPFTPSHAIVALPFVRSALVPAAIAVGAMAPDLPLFVRGLPFHYGRTHDFLWLPLTVLLALILLLIWRCVLRPATRELCPTWLAARLPPEWNAGAASTLRETFSVAGVSARAAARGMILLIVSLALGVVTHIVWDLFTHEGRWGVRMLPVLDEEWGPLPGYKWMQYGTSAIGLVILAVWAMVWMGRRDAAASVPRFLPRAVRWLWWLSLPMLLVAAWGIGLVVYGPITASWTVRHLSYRVLPPACAVWGAATFVLALVVQLKARGRSKGAR